MSIKNWIVAKFGGSSVRDAEAMKRCAVIVGAHPEIKVVIISATYQTTNHLEEIAKTALAGDHNICFEKIEAMRDRHLRLASDLLCENSTRTIVKDLCAETEELARDIMSAKNLSDGKMDQIYSIGERLSSALFFDYLKRTLTDERHVVFKDARDVLKTSDKFKRAEPLIAETKAEVENLWSQELSSDALIVTQGFIGSTLKGETTTLGREGSDYSATLFGEAIGAKLVQIWTDVCGIATGDPRHVDNPIFLDSLSYDEATLMAENGAKVLFERTLAPATRANMEVFVGSSLEPKAGGTHIRSNNDVRIGPKGVAYEPKTQMLTVVGFGVETDPNLLADLTKHGGVWKSEKSILQRAGATYQDFKDVHSLLIKSLK